MNIIDRFSLTTAAPWNWLRGMSGSWGWGRATTSTGTTIGPEQAMRLASVAACIRVLSDSEESLPIALFKGDEAFSRGDPTGKAERIIDDQWGYAELLQKPTDWMNGCEFRGLVATERLLYGNSIFKINRNRRGVVSEFLTYDHGSFSVYNAEGAANTRRLKPEYRLNGDVVPTNKILHFRGPVLKGQFEGVSPITYAASAIDYAQSMEIYGVKMQKNGGKPGGAVELGPGKISEEGFKRVQKSFNESFSGDGVGKIAIMGHGSKYHPVAVASKDAQFLENRKFQRSEIAGIFRVPPHMIGDLEHATFSNIEHQAIQFVVFSLMPWLKRTEATLNAQLLTKDQRAQGYFFKYDIKALLQGDVKSRAEFYKVMEKHLYTDEIRAMEGINPLPDGEGQERLVPLNMFAPEETPESEEVNNDETDTQPE